MDNLDIGMSVISMTSVSSVSAMVIIPVSPLVDNDSLIVVVMSMAVVHMSMPDSIDYHNVIVVIVTSLVDMFMDVLVDIDVSVVSMMPISIHINDITMVSVVSASIDVDDLPIGSVVAINIDDIVVMAPLVHHNDITSVSVAMVIAMMTVVSITIDNDNFIIVVMTSLVNYDDIIAVSMAVVSVSSAISAFVNNNNIASRVDVLVNVLVSSPIVFIVMVMIVVVSMSATFDNNDSVIVVSWGSSIQVQEAAVDWAITSNTIEINVDQLLVSKVYHPRMPTYVVVVSGSLVVSSIKIDKSTMSRTIALDSVNVDVDQLQTSAIAQLLPKNY